MKLRSRLVWQVFAVPFGFLFGAGLALLWTGGDLGRASSCHAMRARAEQVAVAPAHPCGKFRVRAPEGE